MTVSTDWLQRFADLFGVDITDFFEAGSPSRIEFLGIAGPGGIIAEAPAPDIPLPPLDSAVLVAISAAYGSFHEGQLILALRTAQIDEALDRICIAKILNGDAVLARLIRGKARAFTLVPLDGGETLYDCLLEWAALPAFAMQDLRAAP